MVLAYRYTVVNAIHALGEEFGTSTARAVLRSIQVPLEEFIHRQGDMPSSGGPDAVAADASVREAIDGLVDGLGIVRVKVYSRDGTVVHSTDPRQVGQIQVDNPGFVAGIQGRVANKLIYRDHLNPFDDEVSDENLIQTYLPIHGQDSRRPVGVLEIYSDANGVVDSATKSQIIVAPLVVGILLVLYLFLLAVVRRSGSLIELQQHVISERTQTLEMLTARLLSAQESERKRLAARLHEGIAQSLQAVKLAVERQKPIGGLDRSAPLAAIIQEAIDQTREFAVELRPSSLDQFGVIEALNGFFNDFLQAHRELALEHEFAVGESEIPKPLKTIIFRIVQDTLLGLATDTEADRIKVILSLAENGLELSITDNARVYHSAGNDSSFDTDADAVLLPMKERTTFSGGDFERIAKSDGMVSNVARWQV